jgi:hypothetical protein
MIAAALAGAGVLGSANAADAAALAGGTYRWVPVGVGCASAIAVGANNVPWILGCNGGNPNAKGPSGVYYLEYCNLPVSTFLTYCSATGSTGVVVPYPQWTYAGFDGVTLAVNLNGIPWATDASGVPHEDTWSYCAGTGLACPWLGTTPGGWSAVGVGGKGQLAAGVSVSIASPAEPSGMMFYPAPDVPVTGLLAPLDRSKLWGVSSGGGEAYWEEVFHYVDEAPQAPAGWTPGDALVTALAIFTDPPTSATHADGSDTTQVAWAINSSGNVFCNDGGGSGGWTYRPTPEAATWITDHYIVGSSGEVYAWNGTSNGGGNATWSKVIGPLPGGSNGIAMHRIAASQAASGAFAGQGAPIGPSELWGVDAAGNVYWAAWTASVVIQ